MTVEAIHTMAILELKQGLGAETACAHALALNLTFVRE